MAHAFSPPCRVGGTIWCSGSVFNLGCLAVPAIFTNKMIQVSLHICQPWMEGSTKQGTHHV